MLSLTLLLSCFMTSTAAERKISVVTTIFPIYDWVREVTGPDADNVELTMLQDSGVDLHSYQPSVQDIVKVSTCDVFLFVGGESDEWVEGALAEAINKDMKAISLVKAIGEDVSVKASFTSAAGPPAKEAYSKQASERRRL